MPTTHLVTRNEQSITRSGTSALTVTATRTGNRLSVEIEFDILSRKECIGMVGTLLTQLEASHDENLVAQAIAHYAEETGKMFKRSGHRDFALIRGRKQRGK